MPEDPIDTDNSTVRDMRERIKELEAQAKEADDLREQNTALLRQGAIRDAGLELTANQLKALEAVHEGDWTPDAIKASAAELGVVEAPPAVPPPNVPQTELDAQRRLAGAASGADNSPPNPEAEFEAKMAALKADVAAGRKSAEVASAEFDVLYRSQYPERVAIH